VIRNAVIHLANEQPLLADLPALPAASDISLICTNLRALNGKRPVFADDAASLFVFPYAHIRFVEVAPAALAAAHVDGGTPEGSDAQGSAAGAVALIAAAAAASAAQAERSGSSPPGEGRGVSGSDPDAVPEEDLDTELELDEDFLRRVREI
jgi:hypothetical protein